MTFDKPEHQELVRQLILAATFPGTVLDLAMELKQAVAHGDISAVSSEGPAPTTEVGGG